MGLVVILYSGPGFNPLGTNIHTDPQRRWGRGRLKPRNGISVMFVHVTFVSLTIFQAPGYSNSVPPETSMNTGKYDKTANPGDHWMELEFCPIRTQCVPSSVQSESPGEFSVLISVHSERRVLEYHPIRPRGGRILSPVVVALGSHSACSYLSYTAARFSLRRSYLSGWRDQEKVAKSLECSFKMVSAKGRARAGKGLLYPTVRNRLEAVAGGFFQWVRPETSPFGCGVSFRRPVPFPL